jgi:hypothetical protein
MNGTRKAKRESKCQKEKISELLMKTIKRKNIDDSKKDVQTQLPIRRDPCLAEKTH